MKSVHQIIAVSVIKSGLEFLCSVCTVRIHSQVFDKSCTTKYCHRN